MCPPAEIALFVEVLRQKTEVDEHRQVGPSPISGCYRRHLTSRWGSRQLFARGFEAHLGESCGPRIADALLRRRGRPGARQTEPSLVVRGPAVRSGNCWTTDAPSAANFSSLPAFSDTAEVPPSAGRRAHALLFATRRRFGQRFPGAVARARHDFLFPLRVGKALDPWRAGPSTICGRQTLLGKSGAKRLQTKKILLRGGNTIPIGASWAEGSADPGSKVSPEGHGPGVVRGSGGIERKPGHTIRRHTSWTNFSRGERSAGIKSSCDPPHPHPSGHLDQERLSI